MYEHGTRMHPTTTSFPATAPGSLTWFSLWATLGAAIVVQLLIAHGHLLPGRIGGIVLIAATGLGLSLLIRRRRIVIAGRELRVTAAWYSRKTSIDALDLEHARIVDLAEHTELKPLLKTNGIGLPGFRAGHYRLRNRAKAFCLLVGSEPLLALPERDGTMLLLSVDQPRRLLERLRELAATTPDR